MENSNEEMQRKKITACILAVSMVLAMCACGNKGDGKASDSSGGKSSAAPKAAETQKQESKEGHGKEVSTENATGITYPLEEKVHLTMAMVENTAVTANATDLAHTPFGVAWQEATGVELEIMSHI